MTNVLNTTTKEIVEITMIDANTGQEWSNESFPDIIVESSGKVPFEAGVQLDQYLDNAAIWAMAMIKNK